MRLRWPQHRAGQSGELLAHRSGLAQIEHQPGQVAGLLAQRERALTLPVSRAAGLAGGEALARFERVELGAAALQFGFVGAQGGIGLFGAGLQRFAARQRFAQPGGAPRHFGQQRFQHRAQVHAFAQ